MIASLSAWLFRKHCIQHAEPLFDRDENGKAVFRCPECLHTWPILPGFEPNPPHPSAVRARTPDRRVERHVMATVPHVVARAPRRVGALPVM